MADTHLSQPPDTHKSNFRWDILIFAIILTIAVITRFYDLGTRVMSHDESLHTFFSWQLFKTGSFEHTPLMHGPFQFHAIALSYLFFGDNDFTSRIPAVLCSIAAVAFIWQYRHYLGRVGALITAALFTISPFMLYYGRYVRNEAYVVLFGLVSIWAVLRYLETRQPKYLYWLTASTALHFTSKETSFIYTAQILLFLGILFLSQITSKPWKKPEIQTLFAWLLVFSLLLFSASAAVDRFTTPPTTPDAQTTAAPLDPETPPDQSTPHGLSTLALFFGALGLITLAGSLYFLVTGFGPDQIRSIPAFELILLLGSLVFPHLVAFPVRFLGWDPLNYTNTSNILRIAAFGIPMFFLSAIAGLWWNKRQWLINTAIFYTIFILLFTTFLTNSTGFFSGLVGSLGYWLVQQGVERGSQPAYYYFLLQIPVYEYLAALGTLLAVAIGLRRWIFSPTPENTDETPPTVTPRPSSLSTQNGKNLAFIFFAFWAVTSLLAYTLAGEKMPWLAVHIALPLLLLTGWALNALVEKLTLSTFTQIKTWLAFSLLIIFFLSLFGTFVSLIAIPQPFQGQTLQNIQATNTFLFSITVLLASASGLVFTLRSWSFQKILPLSLLSLFSLLSILTIRTSFTAAFINYDQATEYLVYAHAASGVKEAMQQVENTSTRLTNSLSLEVAFDNDVAWPFTWYLRNYPNQRHYGAQLTTDLRTAPIIFVGDDNFAAIEPIVAQGYYQFDYIRMWWPNQDYYDLTFDHIKLYLTDPLYRWGIFQIWLNRDYTAYGQATGQNYSLDTWNPSDRMRLYIRKDVAAQLWDYDFGSGSGEIVIDPYENKQKQLTPDQVIFSADNTPIFNAPRGIAVAPDGSLLVADSQNHRIVHLQNGEIVNQWGYFGALDEAGQSPGGSFNEPWGIAVSPDGRFIYVADTWNHRLQKFSYSGEFITQWGTFGQTIDDPYLLWGPRDLTVDNQGNLLVTDTGNKRIIIYDSDGGYISQFGTVGFELGQFDEPVGIAIHPQTGHAYVADTWNQRIQVFQPNSTGSYFPLNTWDISGWYGQSLTNKPYLTFASDGNLFVTDPDLSRVLVFSPQGEFLFYFGDNFQASTSLGVVIGIAPDTNGGLWLTDGQGNRLLHITLP